MTLEYRRLVFQHTLLAILLESQSRPSYSPSPEVAHVLWIYLRNEQKLNLGPEAEHAQKGMTVYTQIKNERDTSGAA